ncbi:alkene reductase [Mesoflavibacter sp. CH_XMU1404-2]|uniref:alkene reductase n=1 Tax=Mesoflavibacter sp. CH_XMU1404-2 TaxID=3107766 RepID=UPI0030099DAA
MTLYNEYKLKNTTLKNRIVMAPMTRSRAIDNIPNDLMTEYYSQRTGAGLIISEGTSPSVNGVGYARIPGAYSPAQIEGWKQVAEGVHKNDGKIFVQLMHCGRIAADENLPEGGEVISASAVQADGEMYTDAKGMLPHTTPRAMTLKDIESTQNEYVNSAKLLVDTGIDGVELHAANGYLLEQFLNPKSNVREDNYGGNFENRARFVLETTEKVVAAIGGDKVGIRLSPYGVNGDVQHDYEDLVELYNYLALELKKLGIAYIHIADHTAMGAPEFKTDIKATIKGAFVGTVISGGGVASEADAQKVLDEGMDLVYVGRPFISNPDLVEKFKNHKELQDPNPDTFYTPGKEGYTDY